MLKRHAATILIGAVIAFGATEAQAVPITFSTNGIFSTDRDQRRQLFGWQRHDDAHVQCRHGFRVHARWGAVRGHCRHVN